MRKFTIRELTLAAILAAVYAVLTLGMPLPPFHGVQLRVGEALTVLPFLFPSATPGLFVGCVIANLFTPFPLDVVCGSMATLLACKLCIPLTASTTARQMLMEEYNRIVLPKAAHFNAVQSYSNDTHPLRRLLHAGARHRNHL